MVYVEDGELEAGIPQERIRPRLPSCGSLAATLSPLLPLSACTSSKAAARVLRGVPHDYAGKPLLQCRPVQHVVSARLLCDASPWRVFVCV